MKNSVLKKLIFPLMFGEVSLNDNYFFVERNETFLTYQSTRHNMSYTKKIRLHLIT